MIEARERRKNRGERSEVRGMGRASRNHVCSYFFFRPRSLMLMGGASRYHAFSFSYLQPDAAYFLACSMGPAAGCLQPRGSHAPPRNTT